MSVSNVERDIQADLEKAAAVPLPPSPVVTDGEDKASAVDTIPSPPTNDLENPTQQQIEDSIARSAAQRQERARKASETRKRNRAAAIARGESIAPRKKKAKAKQSYWMNLVTAGYKLIKPNVPEGEKPESGVLSGALTNSMITCKYIRWSFDNDPEIVAKYPEGCGKCPSQDDAMEWLKKIHYDKDVINEFAKTIPKGHAITEEDSKACLAKLEEEYKKTKSQ